MKIASVFAETSYQEVSLHRYSQLTYIVPVHAEKAFILNKKAISDKKKILYKPCVKKGVPGSAPCGRKYKLFPIGYSMIESEDFKFASRFFAYMRLKVDDDFKIPAFGDYNTDRQLERAMKSAVDDGMVSEEFAKKLHLTTDLAGLYSLTLDTMFYVAHDMSGIIERRHSSLGNKYQHFVFCMSKDLASYIVKKRGEDPEMERFVDSVLENLAKQRELVSNASA